MKIFFLIVAVIVVGMFGLSFAVDTAPTADQSIVDQMLQTFIQKHPTIKQEVSCAGLNYYIPKIMQQAEVILGTPDATREANIKAIFKEQLSQYLYNVLACNEDAPSSVGGVPVLPASTTTTPTTTTPPATSTPSVTPTPSIQPAYTDTVTENYFRGIVYSCGGGSETKVWNETSCKPYSLWKAYAIRYCPAGTALSSFSTIDSCSPAWAPVAVPSTKIETPTKSGQPGYTEAQPQIETPVKTEKQPKIEIPAKGGQATDINIPVADKMLQIFMQKHPTIKQEVSCEGLRYYISKIMQQAEVILGTPNADREEKIKSIFKDMLFHYLNDVLACNKDTTSSPINIPALPASTTTPTATTTTTPTVTPPTSTKPVSSDIATENYFRGMIYTCGGDGSEKKMWGETSCKPYSLWKEYAMSYCPAGTALSNFSTIDSCSSAWAPTAVPHITVPFDDTQIQTIEPVPMDVIFNLDQQMAQEKIDKKKYMENTADGNISTPSVEKVDFFPTEIKEAYNYALDKGITTQDTLQSADPQGELTRAHMAKMIVTFTEQVLGKTPDTSMICLFNDIADQSEELQNYIIESCQLGLMGQGMTDFHPNDVFTRAQFATTLSRALYGDTYNGGAVYYEEHLKALKDDNIINDIDNPLVPEMRGYVWMMMQRVEEKFQFASYEEINQ